MLSIAVTNLLGDHLPFISNFSVAMTNLIYLGIMFPNTPPRTIMHMLSVQVDIPITSKDLLMTIASLLKPARLRIRIVGVCDS